MGCGRWHFQDRPFCVRRMSSLISAASGTTFDQRGKICVENGRTSLSISHHLHLGWYWAHPRPLFWRRLCKTSNPLNLISDSSHSDDWQISEAAAGLTLTATQLKCKELISWSSLGFSGTADAGWCFPSTHAYVLGSSGDLAYHAELSNSRGES